MPEGSVVHRQALSKDRTVEFSRGYELQDIEKAADQHKSVHAENSGLTQPTTTIHTVVQLYDL